jgi:methionine-rich copper-binding protein CopC
VIRNTVLRNTVLRNTVLRNTVFRRSAAVVLAVLAVLMISGTASAHATPVSSSPAPCSVLDVAPRQIVLKFDEGIDTTAQSIRLVAANGSSIDIGDIQHHAGASSMSADVPDLRDGTYVVAWHAISADSHPVSGAFTFSVRSETATTPGLVARLLATDHTSTAEELGLGIGRSASYVGLALLLGTFAMLALCDSDALRSRRAAGLLGLALVVGVVGTAVMIAAQVVAPGGRRTVAVGLARRGRNVGGAVVGRPSGPVCVRRSADPAGQTGPHRQRLVSPGRGVLRCTAGRGDGWRSRGQRPLDPARVRGHDVSPRRDVALGRRSRGAPGGRTRRPEVGGVGPVLTPGIGVRGGARADRDAQRMASGGVALRTHRQFIRHMAVLEAGTRPHRRCGGSWPARSSASVRCWP